MVTRFTLFTLCLLLGRFGARPLSAEGRRLPARASAEKSSAGHGPELAVDSDESTLWIASLKPGPENNRVWFQLDFGSVQPVARLHWIAAQGTPYPASAPKEYRVLLSTDGRQWRAVPVPPVEDASEPNGDVPSLCDSASDGVRRPMMSSDSGLICAVRSGLMAVHVAPRSGDRNSTFAPA